MAKLISTGIVLAGGIYILATQPLNPTTSITVVVGTAVVCGLIFIS